MKIFLVVINLLIGIGGLFGGFLALSPEAQLSMGISREMLINSPFTTFLIPGLFLFIIIGFGNLLIAYMNVRSEQHSAYFECLIGIIQIFWILIQCILLQSIVFLHILFFLFGTIQILGGIWIIKKTKAPFPFSAKQN